jgi:hypothetical protein
MSEVKIKAPVWGQAIVVDRFGNNAVTIARLLRAFASGPATDVHHASIMKLAADMLDPLCDPEHKPRTKARDEALATLVYEALRWTSFSVDEGLAPDHGQLHQTIDPADVLLNYWEACGRDHELEQLPELVRGQILKLQASK